MVGQTVSMDAAHLLDALRTEGDAAIRGAHERLDMPVPNLDWTVGEVLGHLGGVHRRFGQCLRGDVDTWPSQSSVEVPADDALIDWARTQLSEVVAAIGSADLDARCITWIGERDGHWILRRLANETAVHRWDIEAAGGSPDDLAAPLAALVIEEFVTEIVGGRGLAGADDVAAHDGATLHLHATDDVEGGEWYLTVADGGLDVEHRHDKGDVALRGSASDLALWLSGRIPASRLDAFGPADQVDWWSSAFRFD